MLMCEMTTSGAATCNKYLAALSTYCLLLAAEDGLYLRLNSLPDLSSTGLSLSYSGGHRQRLILTPSSDAVTTLPLSQYFKALSLIAYKNEFAGTIWQTDGTRTIEMLFYDRNECTSTILRQDINVVSADAASKATGLPSACLDSINASAKDPNQLVLCAKAFSNASPRAPDSIINFMAAVSAGTLLLFWT